MKRNILRYELKYTTMEYLNSFGIKTLADLIKPRIRETLTKILIEKYNEVLIGDIRTINHENVKDIETIETIEQVLESTGLSPDCLKLEVTESGIMKNPEQAVAKMKTLRAKGIRFSIDDFGTGYSSLSYLKRFPIDTLKIDRSFVIDCSTNKDDQEIIKTIISMAQTLNLETVAEGVETEEQLDFLIRHGCHIMQGYYFDQPMPANKFEKILQTRGTIYEKDEQ